MNLYDLTKPTDSKIEEMAEETNSIMRTKTLYDLTKPTDSKIEEMAEETNSTMRTKTLADLYKAAVDKGLITAQQQGSNGYQPQQ